MQSILIFNVILKRELLRFIYQRERFLAALVRPLIWLFIFAAGFRAALGLSIIPPYETYISYEVYIVPGLCGMILLFSAMQSSLAMVYDRELGAMRLLLSCPVARHWIFFYKLLSGVFVSVLQVYVFLFISYLYGIDFDVLGYVSVFPALVLSGLMLGAMGLFLSSVIKKLENFASIMNFVIFPMFFLSTALYPLWKMAESSELLFRICSLNPFSYAVELIRFSLYQKVNFIGIIWMSFGFAICFCASLWGYNPASILMKRKA